MRLKNESDKGQMGKAKRTLQDKEAVNRKQKCRGRKITVENNKTNCKSTIERDDTKSEKSQEKEERSGKIDE